MENSGKGLQERLPFMHIFIYSREHIHGTHTHIHRYTIRRYTGYRPRALIHALYTKSYKTFKSLFAGYQ